MKRELCQLASTWSGQMPPAGLATEEKIDGFRALYFRGLDGQPRLWTRNALPIEGAAHILHRLGLFERVAGQPLVIDGEFQVDGTLEATKHWAERGWRHGGEAGMFYAFDVVPMVNWVRGGWEWPQERRKAWLESLAAQVEADASLQWEWRPGSRGADEGREAVKVLPHGWVFGVHDVRDAACLVWGSGGEGLVLKDPTAPYIRGRNRNWLKLKSAEQFTRAA